MDIILASQSPRRRELLGQLGLTFRTHVSDVDEGDTGTTDPAEMVEILSQRKAAAVRAAEGPEPLIIAADTVVALDGTILGKPADPEDAISMLEMLSGKVNCVYTGVSVVRGDLQETRHACTRVRFRTLSQEEIRAYVATGEPLDKAGAYGIQGKGALLVEEIHGDYSNVVGLPLCLLGRILAERFGVELLGGGKRL